MGWLCCGADSDSDREGAVGGEAFAKVPSTKTVKRIIDRVRNVLVVVLPEIPRLFPSAAHTEAEKFEQLAVVLLGVIQRQDKTLTLPQRLECLRRARPVPGPECPDTFIELFVETLHALRDKSQEGEHPQPSVLRSRSFAHGALSASLTATATDPGLELTGIVRLQDVRLEDATHSNDLAHLLTMWYETDTDCSGTVTEDELKVLLEKLNIKLADSAVRALVTSVRTGDSITFAQFMSMYETITSVQDISAIFDRYCSLTKQKSMFSLALRRIESSRPHQWQQRRSSAAAPGASGSGGGAALAVPLLSRSTSPVSSAAFSAAGGDVPAMSREDVLRFLLEEQGEADIDLPAHREELAEMLLVFGIADDDEAAVSKRQFQQALLACQNSWIAPRESTVHHDMRQPLTHYYIDSSHNTYLEGHQLRGGSSTDMYAMALLAGCRCVELDCWDGPNDDPVVTHGNTLTGTIRFRDVIATISDNAFRTSPYPVILSLEVHTSVRQQTRMAEIMHEIFGPRIVTAAAAEASRLDGFEFTPEGLQYKFLIKGKRVRSKDGGGAVLSDDDDPDGFVSVAAVPASASAKEAPKLDSSKIAEALSDITFMPSVKFQSLEQLATMPHYAVSSIDENRVKEWCKTSRSNAQAASVATQMLLRAYPFGLRFDSSNLDPQDSFNAGVHMSAMNIQSLDRGMWLNRHRFRQNGRCGYLLKPAALRGEGAAVSLAFRDDVCVTLCILGGMSLNQSKPSGAPMSPYVEVFMRGYGTDDTASDPKKTAVVKNNAFNPRWSDAFSFRVQAVELATLFVRVWDHARTEIIGENAAPVAALREGYRVVSLFDRSGAQLPYPTGLFVSVRFGGRSPRASLTSAPGNQPPPLRRPTAAAGAPMGHKVSMMGSLSPESSFEHRPRFLAESDTDSDDSLLLPQPAAGALRPEDSDNPLEMI